MKIKLLAAIFLVLTACATPLTTQETAQDLDTPTEKLPATSTVTPLPTITSTSTPTNTPTPIPTPEGEIVSEPLLRFSFFGPAGFEINSGIYRDSYSFAAIYHKTTYWDQAIILIDVDVTDQISVPMELILGTILANLDFFNAAVGETGEFKSLTINQYQAVGVDFTGETYGAPIQGRSIAFQPDQNHIMVGISWFDISSDPDIWENQGIFLFDYVLQSVSFES